LLLNEFVSLSEYTKIDVGWGFTQNQLGASWLVSRGASRQEGNGWEGREGLGGGGEGKGE